MTSSKLPWILLGLTAFLVFAIVSVVAVMVGLDYLRLGETSISLSTPTSGPGTLIAGNGSGQINGVIWHDLCASGQEGQQGPLSAPEGCVATAGGGYLANGIREAQEPGIAGVSVRLGQGACPSVGLTETTTAADGSFRFTGLGSGAYCVSVDPGLGSNQSLLLPGGWSAPLGASQALATVNLAEGEQASRIEFGWDHQFLPLPPSATATVTVTPTPTQTPTPTVTPTPKVPCDWVAFVTDVTVPDGTTFKPDQDFRKTWRLKNIGTCTWTKDYDLVFVSGNRMTGDKATPLTTSVKPGQTIDLSIELTAPIEIGKHTGYWALQNASGVVFGIGGQAKDPFWVMVQVEKPKKIVYDMAANYCDASWSNGEELIECPTQDYDVSGFVQRLDEPVFAGGRVENEQGLWVIPEGVDNGYLSGIFPIFKVASGDRFRTVVSCLDTYTNCNMDFRLDYKVNDQKVKTLGEWSVAYDGKYKSVDLDLTPLAGKEVIFILTVEAGGTSDMDSGVWLHPSIWR